MPDGTGSGCYDGLRLDRQLCFPLYAAAKEVVRRYKPLLDELDLTYTQYILMLVLWERRSQRLKELGDVLYLDSGTLTPVLKKLEQKGYVRRTRCAQDERSLIVTLTPAGLALREAAKNVPAAMSSCTALTAEEAGELYRLLYKLLGQEKA